MRTSKFVNRTGKIALVLLATLATASCTMVMHTLKNGFVSAPPQSEFGLGPRVSRAGSFTATVRPDAPLRTGALQKVHLVIVDSAGQPVRAAKVTIDGGMPQHGHGLPTKPRVSATSVDGEYLVEGLRFNMGGWWELRFVVAGASAADSVTFNVRL